MKIDIETEQLIASIKLDLLQKTFPDELQQRITDGCHQIREATVAPLSKLQMLYKLSGEVMDYVAHFVPCKKSCNQCCFYQVGISDLEIALIENTTGKKAISVTEVDQSETQHLDALSEQENHGTPCPFLGDDGNCTNYEARPYMCRRHATVGQDNHWCHHDRVNTIELPLLRFSELDELYESILQEAGSDTLMDIRKVFPQITRFSVVFANSDARVSGAVQLPQIKSGYQLLTDL